MLLRDRLIIENRLYANYSRRIASKRALIKKYADSLPPEKIEEIETEIKNLQDRMAEIEKQS